MKDLRKLPAINQQEFCSLLDERMLIRVNELINGSGDVCGAVSGEMEENLVR